MSSTLLTPEISLEQAIVANPLIVSPNTSIAEAIACMNTARATCFLPESAEPEESLRQADSCASCVLVMEGIQLVGILTERDVVRLSADGYSFDRSLADVMTRPVITLQQSELTDMFAPLHLLKQHHIGHLPVLDDQGQVVGLLTDERLCYLLCSLAEVLQQKVSQLEAEKEEALKQSEATNRAIIQGIPDLLIRMDGQGEYQEMLSGGAVKVLLPPKERKNPSVRDVLSQNLANQRLHYTALALASGQLQVYEQQIEIDGKQYEEEVRITPLNENEVLVIIRDITDRKRVEESFRQSEAKHRALISALPDLIMRMSGDGIYLDFFPTDTFKVFGDRDLVGIDIHERGLPPELAQLRMRYIQQALQTGELQLYEQEIMVDDEIRTEEVRIVVCAEYEVLVVVRDITDRKRAEDTLRQLNQELESRIEQRTIELRQSEARFRQIFEQSPVGIAISDLEGRLTRVNSSLIQIMGYSKADLLQRSIQDIFSADNQQKNVQLLQQLLEQTLPVMTFESQLVSKRNETVWVNATSALIFNAFGQPSAMVHLIEDVSDRKQMELELQELTLSLQNAMEGISRLDKQGCYLSLNRAYASACGYEPEELVGVQWQKTVHPEDILLMEAVYQTMLEKGRAEAEIRGIRKDGSLFYKQITLVTAMDQEGQFNGHYCFLKDISDRKATEETLKRQLAAIEAAIDGIAILEGGIFTYLNKAHLDFFGYEHPHELLGKSWTALYPPEELYRFQQDILPALRQQWSWQGEVIAIRKDGSTFVEGLSLTIAASGELICVCRDITAQKEAEKQLRQANEQLIIANTKLARATRLKDEFLANMSHELRTPLNAILGMAEGLQEEVFGYISDHQKQAIETIERSGKHLLELINDILDLSKTEFGKLELQIAPVAISYLCESSLTFVRQQAIQKNIQLISEIPQQLPDIEVDERRMRQVLINLLSNAVKFTPNGGRVKLEVYTEQQDQTFLIFSVIDTGIGIAQEDISKLFQPFVQIDSRLNRQYAGTGLGLALVRRFTELHRGSVAVTSVLGQGSCFTVRLPYDACKLQGNRISSSQSLQQLRSLQQKQEQNETTIAISSRSSSQVNSSPLILLAEDNEASAVTVSSYLQGRGYRLILAKNGQEAVALAQTQQPDLILMDIQMPKVDGLDAIQQIRVDQRLAHVPIIALTALAMPSDREKCIAAGANSYLPKPIKLKQLVETIQTLLEKLHSPTLS